MLDEERPSKPSVDGARPARDDGAAQAGDAPASEASERAEPEARRTDAETQAAPEAATAGGPSKDEPATPKRSFVRRHPLALLGIVVAAMAIGTGGYFYWQTSVLPYESTDDAFVDSRQFALSAKISGYVAEVAVDDNAHVDTGDVLFRIDPRDYEAALAGAQARVAAAEASITGADAQIAAQQAAVEEAQSAVAQSQASLQFAQEQARRAQELVRSGAGTVQNAQQQTSALQQEDANLTRARAAVVSAQKQIGSLQAQKATATADLREAEADRTQAELNLDYVTLTAAQPGRVVRLSGAVGQYVQTGQSLAMFVPDDIWVTANFKETQIADMRPGQPVEIRIDAYPDHEIRGHVDSVQPGSGTAFSLLPAENATGNYVKVVQRVPVKIVVDAWPQDVSIGPGMSVVPTVTVRPED